MGSVRKQMVSLKQRGAAAGDFHMKNLQIPIPTPLRHACMMMLSDRHLGTQAGSQPEMRLTDCRNLSLKSQSQAGRLNPKLKRAN